MSYTIKKNNTIIPPLEGWQEKTWYIADIKCFKGNPVHRAFFYSGFLNGKNKTPGGYSGTMCLNYVDDNPPHEIHHLSYLKIIKKLYSVDELKGM